MNLAAIEEIKVPKSAFNDVYFPLFKDNNRTLILYGGRGSAKSAFAAQYIILDLLQRPYTKWIAIRKIFADIKDSQFSTLKWVISHWKLEDLFKITHVPMEITCLKNGNKIIFRGLDKPYKTKSILNPTCTWFEEANEITFDDYTKTTTSLRGPAGAKLRELITFNPENQDDWINTTFFPTKESYERPDGNFHFIPSIKKNTTILHTTYKDNRWVGEDEKQKLESLVDVDDNFYKVYTLGCWGGALKGLVYPKWDTYDKEINGGDVVYGLDFGYNDPMALVKVTRKENDLYVEELFYKSGWTTTELISELPSLINSKTSNIYADHEPDRIEEIYQKGYNIMPADKGKNSIMNGIDFTKNFNLHIHHESNNLIRELKKYIYKTDKNDNALEMPVDMYNHALDAMRYAINTHGRSYWTNVKSVLPSISVSSSSRFNSRDRFQ
jgi:phage terminase large subunit